ncbi:MAG: transposase [Gammaproteobacteria bacterium]
MSLQTVSTQKPPLTPVRCINEQGFSLHAEVRCPINQRNKLEHLCRYITRPAIANERLKRSEVMSPLEFMQRLAALVPRPRLHLIRFHGAVASNAKLRYAIIPRAPVSPPPSPQDG